MVGSIASSPAIDLSSLPAPVLVDQPDYETRLAAKLARLITQMPSFSALVESDPAMLLLEADSYDELVLAQAVNDACLQLLLAYATGANLDQIGANMDCPRLVVTPATDTTDAVMETDTVYRQRIQLAPHQFSVAGPELAYVFHARSAHADVADATAVSPKPADITALVLSILAAHDGDAALVADMTTALDEADWPGDVTVTVLSSTGTGVPSAEVLAAVDTVLQGDVRPLTDNVTVQAPELVDYAIKARIYPFAGPDQDLILETAKDQLDAYLATARKLGRDVSRSAHIAALFVGSTVQRVELDSPAGDIAVSTSQLGNPVSIDVTIGGTEL